MTDAIHTLGENIQLARFAVVRAAPCRPTSTAAARSACSCSSTSRASTPRPTASSSSVATWPCRSPLPRRSPRRATSVDPAIVEHEKAIYMAQAAESGKPEAIQEKMATGRLEKFFKESTLTEQAFVKNPTRPSASTRPRSRRTWAARSRSSTSSASCWENSLFRRPAGRRNRSTLRSPLAPILDSFSLVFAYRSTLSRETGRLSARGGFSLSYCANLSFYRFGTIIYRPFCFRCDDGGRAASLFL